jgi:hypothetical protein
LINDNTLSFIVSETSMTFLIFYCRNGITKRSRIESDSEVMKDEGEKLEVEYKSEYASKIVWNQIEVFIGKIFWDIEPEEKAVRYIFSKAKMAESKIETPSIKSEIEKEVNTEIKKWWHFWK